MSSSDGPFSIARVTLRVSDPERSAEYYAGLVGLRITALDHQGAMLADPAAEGAPLLELVASERVGPAPAGSTGLFHTAFLYPSRGALGAALGRVSGGGFDLTGASDHGVSEALYLDDPDGLGIELYWDRPRADWPRRDGRLEMFTAPLALAPLAGQAAVGSAEETAAGVGVGHVHLRVADLGEARRFWTEQIGLEPTTELPGALFLAADGYHHHVGANTWSSAGGPPVPAELPGLDRVMLSGTRAAHVTSPESVAIEPA